MIDFQTKIMADRLRNEAFHRALKKLIIPGETTVVDLGSGTGFLSFLASRLGAKACYLYEASADLMRLSEKMAKENKIKNCHFFNVYSTQMRNPIKADVVISETLGNLAYEEHIIEIMNDVKRFLKPGGVVLPQQLDYLVAPVVSDRITSNINPWKSIGYDLNFGVMHDVAANNMYVKTLEPNELLDQGRSAQTWDRIDFRKKNDSVRKGLGKWTIEKPTMVYGFVIWWECEIIPGIHFSTSPLEHPTHWEQIFLPLVEPMSLHSGEKLEVSLLSDTRYTVGVNIKWTVSAKPASSAGMDAQGKIKSHQAMDMKKGWIS